MRPRDEEMQGPWHWAARWGIALVALMVPSLISRAWSSADGRPPPATTAVAAQGATPPRAAQARYVGASACSSCHAAVAADWRASQHAQAMQVARVDTVLGDFNAPAFTHQGVVTRFAHRDGNFYMRTDGKDGKPEEFRIAYTFGVYPLQQYLVAFPDGRMQALPVAWDARARSEGGQAWFHLYPNERLPHTDPLHWTRLNQNWNYMCADCHSTNLKRNYDLATDRYHTTSTDTAVACEACHGPGSKHLSWARGDASMRARDASKGLAIRLEDRKGAHWIADAASGIAHRNRPRATDTELQTCGYCHGRRDVTSLHPGPTGRLLDTSDLALLRDPLYFPDGQQREEVYDLGSFLQSRMNAAGVTCSDCHNAHTGKLRAPGNAVCAQCHAPAKFEQVSHHGHAAGSAGAQCAACHMPTSTFMQVDARHDHSLRIPRPDLSASLGVPNACSSCHAGRSPAWLAKRLRELHGTPKPGFQAWALTMAAARQGAPGAVGDLAVVSADLGVPDIVRATALLELGKRPGSTAAGAIANAASDHSALVRVAAANALDALPAAVATPIASTLAGDAERSVRAKAARILAHVPVTALSPAQQATRARADSDYVDSQLAIAERPEAHVNLGAYHADRGEATAAISEYRTAIRLQPDFAPAYLNLADLYRAMGSEARVEDTLERGLRQVPRQPDLLHALGLLRVRQQRQPEAMALLHDAAELRPDNARFAYVYAIALDSPEDHRSAIRFLQAALLRLPNDTELLFALASLQRDAGQSEAAGRTFARLRLQSPNDPRLPVRDSPK